jgi:creatinine amidohydrolase/Fe(II)-dependent formamide hydrolase-like protein
MLMSFVFDIIRFFVAYGFKRMLLMNGHGGDVPSSSIANQTLKAVKVRDILSFYTGTMHWGWMISGMKPFHVKREVIPPPMRFSLQRTFGPLKLIQSLSA